ncbi:hypothetical protein [Bacillus wiedmannii]
MDDLFMFLSLLLSPETEGQNKNEHMDWISLNVPVLKEKSIFPENIDES